MIEVRMEEKRGRGKRKVRVKRRIEIEVMKRERQRSGAKKRDWDQKKEKCVGSRMEGIKIAFLECSRIREQGGGVLRECEGMGCNSYAEDVSG